MTKTLVKNNPFKKSEGSTVIYFVTNNLEFWENNKNFLSFSAIEIQPIPFLGFNFDFQNNYKAIIFDVFGFRPSTCKRLLKKGESVTNGKFIFIGTENQNIEEFSKAKNCNFISIPFSSNFFREQLKQLGII